jgi:hypothetical protein
MKGVTMPEPDDDGWVSPECFRAYVNAEIKVPNTLIAVGPYVGHAALASLSAEGDLGPALARFAKTYAFSPSQMKSVIKTSSLIHRRFGIPVLPDGADLRGDNGIRVFEQRRFEVVYMEGVLNILEAVLRLHGERGEKGVPRDSRVAELMGDPDKIAATIAAFGAAQSAIDCLAATEMSEAFKAKFNFTKSGETPRAMAPLDKDTIQAEVMPFIIAEIGQVLAERQWTISEDRTAEFVRVVTSPELHDEAA